MKETLDAIETLDDRRELYYLFSILPSFERVCYLYWVCDQLGPIGSTIDGRAVLLTISNPTGEVNESIGDFLMICAQYRIDIAKALSELERRARLFTSNPFEKNPNVSIFIP